MSFSTKKSLAITAALLLTGGTASAAVITDWNLDNVSVSADSSGAGTSTINDGAGNTTGRVTFDGLSGFSPGVKVVNDDPIAGSNGDNCIMANANVTCNAEQKTHKRLKLQTTSSAPIDMVFNVNPNGSFSTAGNDGLYKVFQAFGNDTGSLLNGFQVTLGTGVGTGFTISTATDGLSFVQFTDPKNNQFSSFFSEGLFGPADENDGLLGYFSTTRTGFGLAFDGLDSFYSTGLFGGYDDLFGPMLSYDKLPLGYYFDADGDASTDDVLIAHQLTDGTWSQNRSVTKGTDGTFTVGTIATGNGGTKYTTLAALVAALQSEGLPECSTVIAGTACLAGAIPIDDLAKFNLTFYIDPTVYTGDQVHAALCHLPGARARFPGADHACAGHAGCHNPPSPEVLIGACPGRCRTVHGLARASHR